LAARWIAKTVKRSLHMKSPTSTQDDHMSDLLPAGHILAMLCELAQQYTPPRRNNDGHSRHFVDKCKRQNEGITDD